MTAGEVRSWEKLGTPEAGDSPRRSVSDMKEFSRLKVGSPWGRILGQQLSNIAHFYRNAMSCIARRLNKLYGREGHVFGGAMRVTPCGDDDQAQQKLLYTLPNTAKDGLTPHVRHTQPAVQYKTFYPRWKVTMRNTYILEMGDSVIDSIFAFC